MKNRYKRINFKVKIFISLLLCTVSPIIILGLYSYNIYISNINNDLNLSLTSSLDQLKLRMDTTIMDIKKYYIESGDNSEVVWFLDNDISYSDYTNLSRLQNTLECSVHLSEYVSGYTIVNYDTGWVLSNRGLFTYEDVVDKEELDALYNTESDGYQKIFVVNNMDIINESYQKKEDIDVSGTILVMKLPITSAGVNSMLLVNMDFMGVMNSALTDNQVMEITIVDDSGKLVYSSDDEVSSYIINNIFTKEKGSIYNYNLDDISYNVSSIESDVVGWNYYISWDVSDAKEGAIDIVFTTAVILIAASVLLVLLVLTRLIYKPVGELKEYIEEVSEGLETEENSDEFGCISGKIHELVDDNARLNVRLEAQRQQLSEFLLNKLIVGNLRYEQIMDYFTKLNIHPYKNYVVMTVGLKNYHDGIYDEARQDALRFAIANEIPEEIKKRLMMPAACNAKVITLVVGEDDENIIDNKVVEVYKGLEIYVSMNYEFPVKIGVSSIYGDICHFRNAHNEAIEALKNNEVLYGDEEQDNFGGVMFYSDIDSSYHGCTYDRILEKEIKEAVDACDMEKAFEIVDKFLLSITENKVIGNERKFYLYRFMISILLVVSDAGISIDEIYKDYEVDIFESMITIYDINRISSFFKNKMITPIINSIRSYRTSKSSEIIKEITDIIEKYRGNITLTECADELHYHPTYIWKIMKIEKNTTFSDYVSKYKLEQAKELLINTDMTVNDIAAELNYTNSQNFIRFFNRFEGVTPGKYRQIKRAECRA